MTDERVPPVPAIGLVGLGNIGGAAVRLIGRLPGVSRVVLVDADKYEAANWPTQVMRRQDAGCTKVTVQARELARIAPHLTILKRAERIESVPLGVLRHCVLLSCVDSRGARQTINRVAYRLGMPWIDAALDRDGNVRARAYLSASEADCLECAWGPLDYELRGSAAPCAGSTVTSAPTRAPVEYGAIAAGLQMSCLRALLEANDDQARREIASRQVLLDVSTGRAMVARYEANPHCRFDHRTWSITPTGHSARDFTLHQTLSLAGGDYRAATLQLDGQLFVNRLRCIGCNRVARTRVWRVSSRLPTGLCRCGGRLLPDPSGTVDSLSAALGRRTLERPLSWFGLADRDVVTLISGATTRHLEIGTGNTEELWMQS